MAKPLVVWSQRGRVTPLTLGTMKYLLVESSDEALSHGEVDYKLLVQHVKATSGRPQGKTSENLWSSGVVWAKRRSTIRNDLPFFVKQTKLMTYVKCVVCRS